MDAIRRMRAGFRGSILGLGDSGYDEARRVWNAAIDCRPRWIARCATDADVASAVRFARESGLAVSVRGGGHNVAGLALVDDGLVIDLSGMRGVAVEPARRRAFVEGGATWGDVDDATQAHGLATTGGLISTTGVGGFTLGGGIGWLMRRYGLAADNLVSAILVDAHGNERRVADNADAELLWALRGGGGNFGVVTRFELQLHPVDTVYGGQLLFPAARSAEVLTAWRSVCASASDDLTTLFAALTAPPLPFLPPSLQGRPAVAVVGCFQGPASEGEAALAPLRALGPAADLFGPMPYRELQRMLDAGAPPGLHNHWRSEYLRELPDEALQALAVQVAAMPPGLSQMHLHHLGGAVARVAEDATAVAHRSAQFAFNSIATWAGGDGDALVTWARGASESLRRWGQGVYVNFLDDEGPARVRAAYGERTFARLSRIKRRVDPENFFRRNHNVPPAPQGG